MSSKKCKIILKNPKKHNNHNNKHNKNNNSNNHIEIYKNLSLL